MNDDRPYAGVTLGAFLPFALGHFLSFLFRSANAVIYPDLARDLALGPTTLGLLTSVYFLTFAASQLPLGMALDRYGPRRVQAPMFLVAACGSMLFALAESFPALVLARALIGLGVAGSLMAALKVGSLRLPSTRLPFYAGALLAVGGLGAMASTAPLQAALGVTSWRGVFIGLAALSLCASVLIFRAPRDDPARSAPRRRDMLRGVWQLYTSRGFWRLALFSLFAHAAFMSILGLWMGPWLRDVMRFDRPHVAGALFLGTAAMIAGALSFGWITEQMQKRMFQPLLSCGGGIVLFLLSQVAMIGGGCNPYLVVIGFGFFGTATTINYAILAQSVPSHLSGRVTTCFNLLVFVLAFAMQWGIGAMIGRWSPLPDGAYPAEAYRWALALVFVLQVPGALLWIGLRPWRRLSPMLAPA